MNRCLSLVFFLFAGAGPGIAWGDDSCPSKLAQADAVRRFENREIAEYRRNVEANKPALAALSAREQRMFKGIAVALFSEAPDLRRYLAGVEALSPAERREGRAALLLPLLHSPANAEYLKRAAAKMTDGGISSMLEAGPPPAFEMQKRDEWHGLRMWLTATASLSLVGDDLYLLINTDASTDVYSPRIGAVSSGLTIVDLRTKTEVSGLLTPTGWKVGRTLTDPFTEWEGQIQSPLFPDEPADVTACRERMGRR